MNWQQGWIDTVLAQVPAGNYRSRMEAELRDHLETQCRALAEAGRTESESQAEALRAMGEPERLRAEYLAAWQRSWPEQLDYRLKTWAWGCVVMFGAHLLVLSVMSFVWSIAPLLCCYLLPLVSALMLGADYLSYKFQASRHPVWQISVGLFFHWATTSVFQICFGASDGPFWEQLKIYLSRTAIYYPLTFALCIFLGLVFGHMAKRQAKPGLA